MTYVGIIGARKYRDRQSVIGLVHTLPSDSIVITSSCRGVCTWAGSAARVAGLEVQIYAPDLKDIHSREEMVERYYKRNRQLIEACEIVHAFISQEAGLTGGTKYEVRYAKRLGKELFLHWENSVVQRTCQRVLPFGLKEKDHSAGWMSVFSEALGYILPIQCKPSWHIAPGGFAFKETVHEKGSELHHLQGAGGGHDRRRQVQPLHGNHISGPPWPTHP